MVTREQILIETINKVKGLEQLEKQTKVMSRLGRRTDAVSQSFSKQTDSGKAVTRVSASMGKNGAQITNITETLTKKTSAQVDKEKLLGAQQRFRATWSKKLGKTAAEVNQIMGIQDVVVDRKSVV